MTTPPPLAPAERFAPMLQSLESTVASMRGADRLTLMLVRLIAECIRGIIEAFARLADVTQVPRNPAAPGEPAPAQPRTEPPEPPIAGNQPPQASARRARLPRPSQTQAVAASMQAPRVPPLGRIARATPRPAPRHQAPPRPAATPGRPPLPRACGPPRTKTALAGRQKTRAHNVTR